MVSFRFTRIFILACLILAVLAVSRDEAESDNSGHLERRRRTIGGTTFARGHWPWLALMRATLVSRRLFGLFPLSHSHLYCGGVLIADRWILSAAHCFTEFGRRARYASVWEARLATVRLRAGIRERVMDVIGRIFDRDALRNWEVDVERLVIHPQYNQSGIYTNDIAMVKLSRPVPSRFAFIQAINLPSEHDENFPTVGERCITKGWGCTSRGGGPSRQARQITMPIHSQTVCHNYYNLPMDNRICAGHEHSGVGVCQGDSGSPLVCQRGNSFKLAGLVSLTSRNRPESFPAVFTSVKDYIPWIEDVMRRY